MSLEVPKVLMPLAGSPLLEYTLSFLAANGVTRVFVVASSHPETVEAWLEASTWHLVDIPLDGDEGAAAGDTTPSPVVHLLASPVVQSAGDALRELDMRGVRRLVSDPFVLMFGDTVANVDLQAAVDAHTATRATDPTCAMTLLFKRMHASHSARPLADSLALALDDATNQLLQYENSFRKDSVGVPAALFAAKPNVAFRFDLYDCHVDVCSTAVLDHCADNLTFQDLRSSYMQPQLGTSSLSCTFYAHNVEAAYAARVHCPHTYHRITKDVVNRWTYPMVPDAHLGDTTYRRSERGVYRELGATIARDADIGPGSLIGAASVVGSTAVVIRSVIGRGCTLGAGCRIVDSAVWDGAVIGDGVSVQSSIVCNKAVLKPGATLERGSVVSYGVIVGAGVRVPEFSQLTRFQGDTATDGDSDTFASEPDAVGSDGVGRSWSAPAPSELGAGRPWRVFPPPTAGAPGVASTAAPPPTNPATLSAALTRLRAALADNDLASVKAMVLSVLESDVGSTSMGLAEVLEGKRVLWSPSRRGDDDGVSECDSFPGTPVTTDSSDVPP